MAFETVRKVWKDAPADDDVLRLYMASAQNAVLAYAQPHSGASADAIELAVILQARNTWNASRASAGGEFDGSGYGITAAPLDWQIKQLVRPFRAVGAIV